MLARRLIVSVAAGLVLAGCYSPSGGLVKRVGAANTYYSTQDRPTTLSIVDSRTGEPFFTLEIPVGKQLTLEFQEGEGDDPVLTPDLMIYDIFPLGTSIGKLRNSVTVPNAYSRRIDVDYRPAPEQAPEPERPLRTDDLADRPDWWTPEGGPRPEDKSKSLYDE
jgi:hypothetical protein